MAQITQASHVICTITLCELHVPHRIYVNRHVSVNATGNVFYPTLWLVVASPQCHHLGLFHICLHTVVCDSVRCVRAMGAEQCVTFLFCNFIEVS